jgi:hydroxyquinol 1,2-dioxygenase
MAAAASPMQPADLTERVVSSFANCPDARTRVLLQGLVRTLHQYVVTLGLTREEWSTAIRVLTATGHITDEHRQEFVLWSDVLGVSMLVDLIAQDADGGATESTVLGPFYVEESPWREFDESIAEVQAGVTTRVHGRVLSTDGTPIAGAVVDVWQNGDNRLYAAQDASAPSEHLRGRFRTTEDGRYSIVGVAPVPYPIPDDGPVGSMLRTTRRHPWRPAHIHLAVRAVGYQPLVTHIFDSTSEYLDSDAVFAVKPSLVRGFVRREADEPGAPATVGGPWFDVENDLVLAPLSEFNDHTYR